MEKPVTAEEKLLNLIRRVKPSAKIAAVKAPANKQTPKLVVNRIKLINGILIAVIGLSAGYLGVEFFAMRQHNDKVVPISTVSSVSEPAIDETSLLTTSAPQSFSFYAQQLSRRNIFMAPWEKAEVVSSAAGAPAVAAVTNLQQYKLVGIIIDHDSKAILEDSQTGKTLFLSKNQEVNGMIVTEIKDGRVIFNQNGRVVELAR